jgi:hypothetical protein
MNTTDPAGSDFPFNRSGAPVGREPNRMRSQAPPRPLPPPGVPQRSWGPPRQPMPPPPRRSAPPPPPRRPASTPRSAPPPRTPGALSPQRPQPFAVPSQGQYRVPTDIANGKRLSWVERLMLRGIRGELLQQPWFQSMRQQNPQQLVIVSMLGVLLLMLMLQLIGTGTGIVSIVEELIFDALEVTLAYLLLAVGTKLAHRCLFWSCVGGVVASLYGVMLAISGILIVRSVDRLVQPFVGPDVASTGILTVWLVYCLATAVVFAYLAVLVYRGIKRLAG